ncbi:MAG: urease accessory UreF family protein [Pseudomonadota bacterium]
MNTSSAALLQLMRLSSPSLPVGTYSYSQGLEYACNVGWVKDEKTASNWIKGVLHHGIESLDVPIIREIFHALTAGDQKQAIWWSSYLLASRESYELRLQDKQQGLALIKLLNDIKILDAGEFPEDEMSYALIFVTASIKWEISLEECVHGYIWSWLENQVTSTMKLLPLGQTSGQRMLSELITEIPEAISCGLSIPNDKICSTCYGYGIASALHETQYTRLFRS